MTMAHAGCWIWLNRGFMFSLFGSSTCLPSEILHTVVFLFSNPSTKALASCTIYYRTTNPSDIPCQPPHLYHSSNLFIVKMVASTSRSLPSAMIPVRPLGPTSSSGIKKGGSATSLLLSIP